MKDKILALDVGEKVIGLALADSRGVTVEPIPPIIRKDHSLGLPALKKVIEAQAIKTIVIGHPLREGSSTDFSAKVKNYSKKIKKHFPDLSIKLIDETLSTWATLQGFPKLKNRKGLMQDKPAFNQDSFAAREILISYLEENPQPSHK